MSNAVTVPADKLAELQRDAARYQHLRRTTTAVRNSKGERVEVTPELMDYVIDERIAAAGVKASDPQP